ncbi:hypothetical protein UlMin_037748 [Ulmus minor]
MALFDDSQELQNPAIFLDAFFCEEEGFKDDLGEKGRTMSFHVLSQRKKIIESVIVILPIWVSNGGSQRGIVFTIKAHYGFSTLTIVLARDKPWLSQLTYVACLSLAAKAEETHVLFRELSTLKWRMHPVTLISFFNHIIRRLGLKTHLHWEFLWMSTATMLHVIEEIEPVNLMNYQNLLLSVLKINESYLLFFIPSLKECWLYSLLVPIFYPRSYVYKLKLFFSILVHIMSIFVMTNIIIICLS